MRLFTGVRGREGFELYLNRGGRGAAPAPPDRSSRQPTITQTPPYGNANHARAPSVSNKKNASEPTTSVVPPAEPRACPQGGRAHQRRSEQEAEGADP